MGRKGPRDTHITDVDAGRVVAVHPVALPRTDGPRSAGLFARQLIPKIGGFVLIPGWEDTAGQGPIRGDLLAGHGAAEEAGEEEGRVLNHVGGCCEISVGLSY